VPRALPKGKTLSTTRTRVASVVAAAVALSATAGGTWALGGSHDSERTRTKRPDVVCVNIRSGAMRVETRSHPCVTSGPQQQHERRVRWSVRGARGPMGPAGAPGIAGPTGAAGATGPAGPAGADGQDGATGATGPAGADGQDGGSSTTGSSFLSGLGIPGLGDGVDGDTYLDTLTGKVWKRVDDLWTIAGSLLGPQGEPGADGTDGTNGTNGTNGTGGSTLLSSGGTARSMTTILGGLVGTVAVLPLSGATSADGVSPTGGAISAVTGGAAPLVQPVQSDTTITGMSARFVSSLGLSLVGSTVDVSAQIWKATGSSGDLQPVAGTKCNAGSLSSVISVGNVFECTLTNLTVPLQAGDDAVIVFSSTASGLSLLNTVTGYMSASVTLS
jgi:BclB C-terminal domain-containing protein